MELSRSPLMMNPHDTALLVVDIQEKLLPHIRDFERLVWNTKRLIIGAKTLGVKIVVSEQYPQGLGKTSTEISDAFASAYDATAEKKMFSCRECESLVGALANEEIKNVMLVGIETHVCVMQTALDFLASGFEVFVCNDAVGSRHENDHLTALKRMGASGVNEVTTEMALFEWCESASSEHFKKISSIVQEDFGSN